MIKIFNLFEKHVLEKLPQITFVSLTVVFLIISLFNIGLLADGTWIFINILTRPFSDISYRLFALILLTFPQVVSIKLGIINFNFLIILHAFWYYLVPLICLFITYKNIPRKYINLFDFVLLSYLICINFIGCFITSESFLCAGLFWIISIIFMFENFNDISYKKLFLILISAFLLIQNYQWSAVFALLFMSYLIIKIRELNFKKNTLHKIIKVLILFLILIMFFLTIRQNIVIYSQYKQMIIPDIIRFYTDQRFIQFIFIMLFISFILVSAFIKQTKFICILLKIVFIYTIFLLFKYNFLYSIAIYKVLNFAIPLIFLFILFYVYKRNILLNYKIIKILNLSLLIIFILNIFIITNKWNKELNTFSTYLTNTRGILLENETFLKTHYKLQEKYYHLNPYISIILQRQKGISELFSIAYLDHCFEYENPLFNIAISKETLPDLTKFNIIYSDELLKKIEQKEFIYKN